MAESKSNVPHPLVPRAARALCDLARAAGLEVSAITLAINAQAAYTIKAYDDEEDRRHHQLVSTWSGPARLFAKTGLFTPAQCRAFESPTVISRFVSNPLLSPCALHHRHELTVFTGRATGTAEHIRCTVNLGPLPLQIEMRGAVEIATGPDTTAWHGSAADLIAAGIPRDRLPLAKQSGKTDRRRLWMIDEDSLRSQQETLRQWAARRQPDGSIVYRVETAEAFERRVQEWMEEERRRQGQNEQARENHRQFEAIRDEFTAAAPDGHEAQAEETPAEVPQPPTHAERDAIARIFPDLDADDRDEVIWYAHARAMWAQERKAGTDPAAARRPALRLVVDNTAARE